MGDTELAMVELLVLGEAVVELEEAEQAPVGR
jgi:hypothetical protein